MAYKIKWSPRAVSSLEDICDFIAKDSEYYAALFAKRIIVIVNKIKSHPKLGRVVPEYNDENLREKIYGNYRIVYRIGKSAIEIVAICHGAKPLNNLEY
jgi:toxin ParE1/3/4